MRPVKYMKYMASVHEVHEVYGARMWGVGIHVPRITLLQRKDCEREREKRERYRGRRERARTHKANRLYYICCNYYPPSFIAAVLSLRSLPSLWQVATKSVLSQCPGG